MGHEKNGIVCLDRMRRLDARNRSTNTGPSREEQVYWMHFSTGLQEISDDLGSMSSDIKDS